MLRSGKGKFLTCNNKNWDWGEGREVPALKALLFIFLNWPAHVKIWLVYTALWNPSMFVKYCCISVCYCLVIMRLWSEINFARCPCHVQQGLEQDIVNKFYSFLWKKSMHTSNDGKRSERINSIWWSIPKLVSFIVGGTVPDIVMFIQNCSTSLAMVTVPEKWISK